MLARRNNAWAGCAGLRPTRSETLEWVIIISTGDIYMSNNQSEIQQASATALDAKGIAIQIPADPLADAKSWLAAMETSLRRTAQQAQQSTNVADMPGA